MDGFWGRIDLSKDKVVSRDDNEFLWEYCRDEEKDGSPHCMEMGAALCSECSMFRRFYIPKVLCSEGSIFRKSIANSVFYLPTKYTWTRHSVKQ